MKDAATRKEELKKLIDTAAGRIPADLVIKNCKVVNVFSGEITEGNLAFSGGQIAGMGDYEGKTVIDAEGRYAAPGFIDSHIHIESSYVCPEELGRLLVPHGGTTIMADPHEIVNVCGIPGLDYMMKAAENTVLDVKYELPSCVPATPWEHSGAVIDAEAMKEPITREGIAGLGEFMNFPGVINAAESDLDKIMVAKEANKFIDGHGPGISDKELNAYSAAGIVGDHECSTVEEMKDRLERGMYILLRQGSACHNLRPLLKGLTPMNSRRCLLCSDDRQPKTMLHEGHLDNHLKICVEEGVDPVTAIRMATLNAAECFGLKDRGAIAPGYRADVVLLDDLKDFHVNRVFIEGTLVAEEGNYLPEIKRYDISSVKGSVIVKDFSKEKFKMHLKSNKVNVIKILPGGVVTQKTTAEIKLDDQGEFVRDPEKDLVKVAVVERHQGTGNVACGFLEGYGIKEGAVALSVAHDSHNIIVVGVSDEEMEFAVNSLIKQEGGIVLVKEGKVIESMPMPIAGLMSDQSGEWVDQKLTDIHAKAYEELGICGDVEPVMTLCFMSLAVIPEVKLTDMGLFDVTTFSFIPVEAE
ncbi:adenine deaminase [Mediterraneibacter butyricigenes]|uniref:Adenine deaminase n=1 Tax=Mediterraneibacter butyricigenes TaxID=2316025 RepID=A0A391PKC4_9FIRM|nr:adenine deaminase [Mediterraneibacter butyricigenes]GCA67252.1 adenine deaminase [Mediterraneibacter butyricigenes]